MEFTFRISEQQYRTKEDASADIMNTSWIDCKAESAVELYRYLLEGHTYCPVFNGFNHKKQNFLYSQFVFVDIDHSDKPLPVYLDEHFPDMFADEPSFLKDSYPPTFAYPSLSNGKNGEYRFRLVWAFENRLDAESYVKALEKIIEIANITDYDPCIKDVSRIYFGTNAGDESCFILADNIYNAEQFVDNYIERIVYTNVSNGEYVLPDEVKADLADKNITTFEVLKKYSGKTLEELCICEPDYIYGNGAKLWIKPHYRTLVFPFNRKIKDGQKRRYKFAMMMYQLKDINPDISFHSLFIAGVCIANLYFEHNSEFGDFKSIKGIVDKVYSDPYKRRIDWYCQSKAGDYIVRNLDTIFGKATRSEVIASFENEVRNNSAKFDDISSLLYYIYILDEKREKICTPNKTTSKKKYVTKKPKPKTLEELEELYAAGKISRRTYFNYKKKL